MPCPDKIEKICLELGEDIDSEVCQELRAHFEECPDCKAFVDSLRKTVYLYRAMPAVLPSRAARENLFKKLKL